MLGQGSATLQRMVVTGKDAKRQRFGELLNGVLNEMGAPPGRGRVQWLYDRLKKGGKEFVSYEQCRKYVRGIDMPDHANFFLLCEQLGTRPERLQPTRNRQEAAGQDVALDELLKIWGTSDDGAHDFILEAARLVQKRPPAVPFSGPERPGKRY